MDILKNREVRLAGAIVAILGGTACAASEKEPEYNIMPGQPFAVIHSHDQGANGVSMEIRTNLMNTKSGEFLTRQVVATCEGEHQMDLHITDDAQKELTVADNHEACFDDGRITPTEYASVARAYRADY